MPGQTRPGADEKRRRLEDNSRQILANTDYTPDPSAEIGTRRRLEENSGAILANADYTPQGPNVHDALGELVRNADHRPTAPTDEDFRKMTENQIAAMRRDNHEPAEPSHFQGR